ncbi:hypothetical protein D5086_017245 [Populus alba]|uniref:Uncharacterized protein n=1 Tax=Populus alba TaxID=43335 RepID=A0ACC4BW66_POPAL
MMKQNRNTSWDFIPIRKKVNLIGVVLDFSFPSKSKGTGERLCTCPLKFLKAFGCSLYGMELISLLEA